MILFRKTVRAAVACMFLLLAAWQPGLAAAATAAASESVTIEAAGPEHDGGVHGHAGQPSADSEHDHTGGSDHHGPSSPDLCCEMDCVMSQAMPASSPLIHVPEAGGLRADFAHALLDGQFSSVIKPPRTIS